MNPIPVRFPVIGIALAAILIAGVTFTPTAEAQIRKPAKEQATIKGESSDHDHKGEIVILTAQAREYDAIVAKARRIQPKSLSPRDINQFNARMAPVRKALQSWAAKYKVESSTKSLSRADAAAAAGGQAAAASRFPDVGDNLVATCPAYVRSGGDDCELIGATLVDGEMICEYHCSKSKDLDRQDDDVQQDQ